MLLTVFGSVFHYIVVWSLLNLIPLTVMLIVICLPSVCHVCVAYRGMNECEFVLLTFSASLCDVFFFTKF